MNPMLLEILKAGGSAAVGLVLVLGVRSEIASWRKSFVAEMKALRAEIHSMQEQQGELITALIQTALGKPITAQRRTKAGAEAPKETEGKGSL
ncbi:hypothetical protein [Armatimonas sp.]|uniref:hypothetical protein n=1 Tax=Armatimonas sp. TaxID=1872638 RepID=UPI0037528962